MTRTAGIHHVSTIARDAQQTLDFYTAVLGLRLVKRTVNFDDPSAYHLYFGDANGSPGSLLTLFPYAGARAGRVGPGQVAVTRIAIAEDSVGWWLHRLIASGVRHEIPRRRGEEIVIALRDPDGAMLELVGVTGSSPVASWPGATFPEQHLARGIHSVELWVDSLEGTDQVLRSIGFDSPTQVGGTHRYSARGDTAALVDVRAVGGFPRGEGGAGTVHHVAFRAADTAQQLRLRATASDLGLQPTTVQDRSYFQSVYFREPAGVLFEIATDGPGFAIDEPIDALGERLMLPAMLEQSRESIERALPELHATPSAVSPASSAFLEEGP